MGVKRVRVGDVFEIPLSNERKTFGQYVFKDIKTGPLILVFDLIAEAAALPEVSLERLRSAVPLFPPIFADVYGAVRRGLWPVVGRMTIEGFVYEPFISTFHDPRTGRAAIWFLWDGEKSIRIGWDLPEECKKLEYLVIWSPHDVVERIETGRIPYPYGDLVQHNKYTPTMQ